ncbi:MAG: replication-associated recombination protein A [Pseudomonadota bacterium]
MDLFADQEAEQRRNAMPLAARMRPRSLTEFVGQQHFLGEGKLLRRLVAARRLTSAIFYGPPGTGKTTLAKLLAAETGGALRELSAVTSGVKELRELLTWAANEQRRGAVRPIVFVDEIHRFNRAQQDALLPDVENGVVSLIGATTSNPFFAVNGALLSRSQIFQFEPLSETELAKLLTRALNDPERGLGQRKMQLNDDALEFLAKAAEGDARKALNVLEVAALSTAEGSVLTVAVLGDSMQRKTIQYDGTGDAHYDAASALIKSVRGSDPDAALYWLARMLEAGEDIRFLCRRLSILASEDIGNADPQALVMAAAATQTCEFIGLPECQLTLSQLVTYLALAEKSNAATTAIAAARDDVRTGELLPVPRHLRDRHYAGARILGHGDGYVYAHEGADGIVEQDYLGVARTYYQPSPRGWEADAGARLAARRDKLERPPTDG